MRSAKPLPLHLDLNLILNSTTCFDTKQSWKASKMLLALLNYGLKGVKSRGFLLTSKSRLGFSEPQNTQYICEEVHQDYSCYSEKEILSVGVKRGLTNWDSSSCFEDIVSLMDAYQLLPSVPMSQSLGRICQTNAPKTRFFTEALLLLLYWCTRRSKFLGTSGHASNIGMSMSPSLFLGSLGSEMSLQDPGPVLAQA